MRLRVVLIALLVAATAAFVVGVSIERSQGEAHAEPASTVEGEAGEAGEAGHEEGAERGEETRADESPGVHADEENAEKFLGIDYEAVPFIVLAAAVWLHPRSVPLLAGVVAALHLAVVAVALALARRAAASSRPLA
jgi:hypothetical protein